MDGPRTDGGRPDPETVEGLAAFETPLLADVVGNERAMDAGIEPVADDVTVAGTALTVEAAPADNLALHRAVARASEGDVLVVDADGYPEAGIWGELMAIAAAKRGIAGTVVDGGVRDVLEVSALGYPLFARHVSPKGSTKLHEGRVDEPVVCGGVSVRPGDVVVGDANGVVAVPGDEAAGVIEACRRKEEREAEYRESGDVIENYVTDSGE